MWVLFMISATIVVVLCRVFDHDRIADQTKAYYGSLNWKKNGDGIRIFW